MDLSLPSYHEVLRRSAAVVAVVEGVQPDSHAKVQSLVDGGLDAPTARVLMVDGLLYGVEDQELECMTGHVGTQADVVEGVVAVGELVERYLVKPAMIQEGGQLAGDASGRVVLRPS